MKEFWYDADPVRRIQWIRTPKIQTAISQNKLLSEADIAFKVDNPKEIKNISCFILDKLIFQIAASTPYQEYEILMVRHILDYPPNETMVLVDGTNIENFGIF